MNIHNKVPFLGGRDYVHSTTIIDCVFGLVGRQESFRLKCKRKISNNNIILNTDSKKDGCAIFSWNNNRVLSIVENDYQKAEYVSKESPYDTLKCYDIKGHRLGFSQPGGLDFLCSAIALNKLLLNSQIDRSERPQWFVGQLTVDDNRDQWEKLTLVYQGTMGGKLFSSHVEVDGSKVAELLFWKDAAPD